MLRQSHWSRLRSALAPQRKLFLLVFLWTCLCLLVFKSILFNSADGQYDGSGPTESIVIPQPKLHARSAASNGPLAEPFIAQASSISSTPAQVPSMFELAPELGKQSRQQAAPTLSKDAYQYSLTGLLVDSSASDGDGDGDDAVINEAPQSQQVQTYVDSLGSTVIQQPHGDSDRSNPSLLLKYQQDSSNRERLPKDTQRQDSSAPQAATTTMTNDDEHPTLLPGSSSLQHSLALEESRREQQQQQAIESQRSNHNQEFTSDIRPSLNSSPKHPAKPLQQQQTAASKVTTANAQNQHPQHATSGNTSRNSNNKPNNNLSDAQFKEARAAKHTNEQPVAGSACHYEFPNLFDLQFNNIYWQKLTTKLMHDDDSAVGSSSQSSHIKSTTTSSTNSNASHDKPSNLSTEATFYLYNAYYDNRWRAGLPSVRVLAMIDRIQPPPTNCLLWSSKLRHSNNAQSSSSQTSEDLNNNNSAATSQSHANPTGKLVPLVTRAQFVYAWYPKWGNYKDGILQPWIITCPVPRSHVGLVPDSVSLVEVRREIRKDLDEDEDNNDEDSGNYAANASRRRQRDRREALSEPLAASIAMPPSFSSSSPALASAPGGSSQTATADTTNIGSSSASISMSSVEYECEPSRPITNNLIVYNHRPEHKQKFAVCVKGLDFPHEDVSVRLVEWIELLNLLGASKIFLYELDVHENISKVLDYYRKRGIVELTPLTLPGDQPNLPEYQHIYLKSKLTAKRQNELIPYNDCLYRNLNSYQYLALLDIDEIIMPLQHHNWYDLMNEVETKSLSEQNYSRASYNVRNVYFFDDLSGPLGTTSTSSSSSVSSIDSSDISDDNDDSDKASSSPGQDSSVYSLERGIPHYLHMMSHVYRSKNYTEPGQYVKCFHNTERIVSLHNHFPMNCFGQCTTYSIPVSLAHLQHYRKDCVGPLKQSCKRDFRVFTTRDTTIWKYNQPMIKRTTRVLNHLGLLRKTS